MPDTACLRAAAPTDLLELRVPDTLTVAGYRPMRLPQAAYLISAPVKAALAAGWDPALTVTNAPFPQPIPPAWAQAVLTARRRSGAVLFDQAKAGLRTDPAGPGQGEVRLRRVGYFDGPVSNDIAGKDLHAGTGLGEQRLVRGADLCSRGKVWDLLSASRCSNHLGVSVLAVSADNQLCLTRKGARSAQSAGLLAPTGSGSVDWDDVVGHATLLELARAAALRELAEEAGVAASAVRCVGYGRHAQRGGKPELVFVAELAVSAGELAAAAGEGRARRGARVPPPAAGP